MKNQFDQFFDVVEFADSGNRIFPQMGMNIKRLGIGIADTADTEEAGQFGDIIFEFGAERRIFDIVNNPFDAGFLINRQAAFFGAQMRVIIGSEEQIHDTIRF